MLSLLADRLGLGVGEQLGVSLGQDIGVAKPATVGGELLVVELRWVAQPVAKRPPLVRAHHEGAHHAVACLEGRVTGARLARRVAHDVGTLAPAIAVSMVWISASCADISMWSPTPVTPRFHIATSAR